MLKWKQFTGILQYTLSDSSHCEWISLHKSHNKLTFDINLSESGPQVIF